MTCHAMDKSAQTLRMWEMSSVWSPFFGYNGKIFTRPKCFSNSFLNVSPMKLTLRPGSLRISRWQETVSLFAGLAVVSTLWGCGPTYSERIWDRGLRPVIQVIPERDWAAEVPMCPSCLATTTRLPLRNYLIKVRWGQWEILEHEFQHIWEWETTGTTDHIILLHDEKPISAANSAGKKPLEGQESQQNN